MKSKLLNLKFNKNFKEGFTLIELLIVIAIIGILATFLMVNFLNVQQKARDAQRKSDVRQIQSALELYRADQGAYPATLYSADCSASSSASLKDPGGTVIYMQKIPCDPSGTSWYNSGKYNYSLSGNTYTLQACIENSKDTDQNIVTIAIGCLTTKGYQLTNP